MTIDTRKAISALEMGFRNPIADAYGKALALRIPNPAKPTPLALAISLFQYDIARGVSKVRGKPLPKEVSDLPVPIQNTLSDWALHTIRSNLPSDEEREAFHTAYLALGLFRDRALYEICEEREKARER